MAFMLVILPQPAFDQAAQLAWAGFHSVAGLGTLAESKGVFCISETAWIFDTKKALQKYAKLVHVADQQRIQLHIFPLDAESVLAHGVSYPQSEKLEAFLSS